MSGACLIVSGGVWHMSRAGQTRTDQRIPVKHVIPVIPLVTLVIPVIPYDDVIFHLRGGQSSVISIIPVLQGVPEKSWFQNL